jgi:hypothetical protein
MGLMIIQHKVQDFATWKPIYDSHASARSAAGLTNGRVFRSVDDPNEVTVLLDTADAKQANDFLASEDLKNAMQRAGVVGQPEIYVLEKAD